MESGSQTVNNKKNLSSTGVVSRQHCLTYIIEWKECEGFGRPGTGKTLTAKFILRKIEREAYISSVYVNCWEHNSYYSVLDKLVRELRILGAEKLNTSFKLERLERFTIQAQLPTK